MKRRSFVVILALGLFVIGCGGKQAEEKEVLARINDYELSLEEFEYQLVREMEMDEGFKLTRDAKSAFLEQIIQKELLIQEAKRLKLDRRKEFTEAIERYWESTLIRDLMALKGNEVVRRASVTQEEIQSRYERMKESNPSLPPLESIEGDVVSQVTEEKKREKLAEWLKDIREKAKIEVNEDLLRP
jgi:hypothetical protein